MTPEEALRERGVVALERIADTLNAIHHALQGQPVECPHPEEERQDLGSTMGHERWRCKVCGYEVTT
jgi:transposase-like protein